MSRTIATNIGKLYTLAFPPLKRATMADPVINGELEIEDGRVTYAGVRRTSSESHSAGVREASPFSARGSEHANPYPPQPALRQESSGLTVIDAKGAMVTPGLVDPHTHAVYGGSRAFELPLKLAGVPYLEILKRGGGILATVRATRAATDGELFESAKTRLLTMLSGGTTTVEIKSGYGLSTDEELRILRIIAALDEDLPITIVPTFMGAHAVPEEYRPAGTEAYVEEIITHMLPAVARQGIAKFCDVFCETGGFTIDQSRRVLEAAKKYGLAPKLHADEIDVSDEALSGAELAAEIAATSADHLRETGRTGFAATSRAGVIPVVLPATSFCLRDHHYANARAMIDDFNLPVALATDCNPGTSPTESLQLVMAIAALELRMTPEEILAGVTINAAAAIGLAEEVGSLAPGKLGDAVIWQAYDLDMLPYRFGSNQATLVIKAGVPITVLGSTGLENLGRS